MHIIILSVHHTGAVIARRPRVAETNGTIKTDYRGREQTRNLLSRPFTSNLEKLEPQPLSGKLLTAQEAQHSKHHSVRKPRTKHCASYYFSTCTRRSDRVSESGGVGLGVTQVTVFFSFQCCFTSTETLLRTIRDGGAQDGHLDFHTAPEL